MKQFYVVKNANYVTICTIALRDKNLSLKAKGLYAFMANLPSEWDYTIAGLVAVLKEGRDAVMSALNELIENGYLQRYRVRTSKGQMGDVVYILRERPNVDPNVDCEKQIEAEKETKVGKSHIGEPQAINTYFVSNERNKEKLKKKNCKTPHFANERTYTEEELNNLIDNVDEIKF